MTERTPQDPFRPDERRRATAWAATTAPEPAFLAAAAPAGLGDGTLYRAVSGLDDHPVPMPDADRARLGDPLALAFFRDGNRRPMTVTEVLAGLDAVGAVPEQRVFLVGEAGQIPPASAPALPRDLRYVITRSVGTDLPDLLISTGANGDPERNFLQIAAWDATAGVFNYYMRLRPAWVWTGDSWTALDPATRGRGCFDSHVNGSVVMKELKQPWMNWQSMAATIQVADGDPLRSDPLYRQLSGAESLEPVVRALIDRWTARRLGAVSAGGTVEHPERLLRHLFTTTTVNLTSTSVQSAVVSRAGADLALPLGFWLADSVTDDLGLPLASAPPLVPAPLYLDSVTRFGFRLEERASGFSQPGDSFFAFVVPEAAYEDRSVVNGLISAGLVPRKFAACALMTDFTNPVFSADREALMKYVPTAPAPASALYRQVADAITRAAASLPATSPEGRFAAGWALADDRWQTVFAGRVDAYLEAAAKRVRTQDGFDDMTRLAESRRRDFRARKLNEFELTLPVTDIAPTAPRLRMTEEATIVEVRQQ